MHVPTHGGGNEAELGGPRLVRHRRGRRTATRATVRALPRTWGTRTRLLRRQAAVGVRGRSHGAGRGALGECSATRTTPTGRPITGSTTPSPSSPTAGYDGVALTLDVHHLDPFADDLVARGPAPSPASCAHARARPRRRDRRALPPRPACQARAHPGHRRRSRGARAARRLPSSVPRHLRRVRGRDGELLGRRAAARASIGTEAWHWLVGRRRAGCSPSPPTVASPPSLEPEPGMLVETVDDWERLRRDSLGSAGDALRIALDTGHCLVTGDRDPADAVRHCAAATSAPSPSRTCVAGVHEHLPFGDGRDGRSCSPYAALSATSASTGSSPSSSRATRTARTKWFPAALAYLKAAETAEVGRDRVRVATASTPAA